MAASAVLLLSVIFPPTPAEGSAVQAEPGEDVTLPCHFPEGAAIQLLHWTGPEGNTYLYRDGRLMESYLSASYRGRAAPLSDPETGDGDASVVLRNVTVGDTGRYECRTLTGPSRRRKRHAVLRSVVIVTVARPQDAAVGVRAHGHVAWATPLHVAAATCCGQMLLWML